MKDKNNALPILCDTCGGPLWYSSDGLEAACPYCGNRYNFRGGRSEALSLALSRANSYRLNCDFSEAEREYSLILERNPQDAEAHWGMVLSRYGVEYVPDPRTGLRVPTCRRTVKGSILQDENYINAVKYAPPAQAQSYAEKARAIERLQAEIKQRMEKEEDFDVFLCFRSTDDGGRPTKERVVARRIYDELTRRGIKTFMSEVTLKGRLGEDYEPIIYKALYSCKFFILIACSAQNINSPWVKNEWSRFCDRISEERLTAACCAVFEGLQPSELPSFFRGQGVDLSKYPAGGYEIEIADNLQTRFFSRKMQNGGTYAANNAAGAAKNYGSFGAGQADDLFKILDEGRAALSRGDFVSAAAAYSRAIERDGDCGEAWLGAFMAELEVRQIKSAKKFAQEVSNRLWASGGTAEECTRHLAQNAHILYALSSPYYKNAVKYSTPAMARMLSDAKVYIMDMADKCNAALKLCADECAARERADSGKIYDSESGNYYDYDDSGSGFSSAAAFLGGAAIGGALGGFLGRRSRFARPPRFPWGRRGPWPPRPPRPPRFGGPRGGRRW